MNRSTLQQLSSERIEDARALLAAQRWSGTYYLTGYALECALKSCVLTHIEKTGVIFLDRKFAEKCWTHDIEIFVEQSGLKIDRDMFANANPNFEQNWQIAKDWKETSRYELNSQAQAEELFKAVTDVPDGVLQWVKSYW